MPGSASSCSLVAELMSSFSAVVAAALEALADIEESVLDCAFALVRPKTSVAAKIPESSSLEIVRIIFLRPSHFCPYA
jgi:hypothetical protein